MNTTDLNGKVAIVTGAGRPQTARIALALAAAGARVAVVDLNPDHAARVAKEIEAAGGEALEITADVASKFQCVNIIETTRARWGRLDILVNGTLVEPHTPFLKIDEWEWVRCLDVNLKGTFFMSQLCGRVFADENQARGGGVIINLGSMAAFEATEDGGAVLAASQTGLLGLARELARELVPQGVRVNTILAGDAVIPLPDGVTTFEQAGLPGDVASAVVELGSLKGQDISGGVFVRS